MINVNILDDFWNGENTIVNAVIQSNNNVSVLIYYQIQQRKCQCSEQLHTIKCYSLRHSLILDGLSWKLENR